MNVQAHHMCRLVLASLCIAVVLVGIGCAPAAEEESGGATGEALSSWNDGAARQAILSFVQEVTDPQSTSFVPPEDRVATFDNDGTLWA